MLQSVLWEDLYGFVIMSKQVFTPETRTVNKDRRYFIDKEVGVFEKWDEDLKRGKKEASFLVKFKVLDFFPNLIDSKVRGKYFITRMQLVPGKSLENISPGELTQGQKWSILKQLTMAITKMISMKMVHGDINESNILFDIKTDKLYLIDFEKARLVVDMNIGETSDLLGYPKYGISYIIQYIESNC